MFPLVLARECGDTASAERRGPAKSDLSPVDAIGATDKADRADDSSRYKLHADASGTTG